MTTTQNFPNVAAVVALLRPEQPYLRALLESAVEEGGLPAGLAMLAKAGGEQTDDIVGDDDNNTNNNEEDAVAEAPAPTPEEEAVEATEVAVEATEEAVEATEAAPEEETVEEPAPTPVKETAEATEAAPQAEGEGEAFAGLNLLWRGTDGAGMTADKEGLVCLRRASQMKAEEEEEEEEEVEAPRDSEPQQVEDECAAAEVVGERADDEWVVVDATDAPAVEVEAAQDPAVDDTQLMFRSPRRVAFRGNAAPDVASYKPTQLSHAILLGHAVDLESSSGVGFALLEAHGRLTILDAHLTELKALIRSHTKTVAEIVETKLLRHNTFKNKKHDKSFKTPRFIHDVREVGTSLSVTKANSVAAIDAELAEVAEQKHGVEGAWAGLTHDEQACAGGEIKLPVAKGVAKKRKAVLINTQASGRQVSRSPTQRSAMSPSVMSSPAVTAVSVPSGRKRTPSRTPLSATRSSTYYSNGRVAVAAPRRVSASPVAIPRASVDSASKRSAPARKSTKKTTGRVSTGASVQQP